MSEDVNELNMLLKGKKVVSVNKSPDNKIQFFFEWGFMVLVDNFNLFKKRGEVAATDDEVKHVKKRGEVAATDDEVKHVKKRGGFGESKWVKEN